MSNVKICFANDLIITIVNYTVVMLKGKFIGELEYLNSPFESILSITLVEHKSFLISKYDDSTITTVTTD